MSNTSSAPVRVPGNRPEPTGARVGLVLGGGGAVGAAYHAGALAALEHDLGWDARRASVIVGTSAGSLVGALLRSGVPSTDLAALTVGADVRDASPELVTSLLDRPAFPPISLGSFLRTPRMPSPMMMLGLAKLTMRRRAVPFGALSMMLPEGREVLAPHLAFIDELARDGAKSWPDDPLLVCAVRRRDWRRIVFGSRVDPPPLSLALAASCAVPGYFAGVEIDGEVYVDGGAISATNADVVKRHELDLAIVVSPMTGKGRRPSVSQFVRDLCRRTLDQEVRALERHGIATVVIEPGAEVLAHMSMDFMSEAASVEIVQNAFLDTGGQIRGSAVLRSVLARHGSARNVESRTSRSA
jgi:NTE family protein